MNDDQYLLANAYFDGELTDDDLRIAEADPDVMSEVGRLRSLQSLLRDSDLPSLSARTAAIAAAMSEFAPVRGTAGTGTAGTGGAGSSVTSGHVTEIRRRRPAASRYLAVAAAVVAIGAAGAVVAGVIGSDSDSDESSGADLAVSTESPANVDAAELSRGASATTLASATAMAAEADQMLPESAPGEGSAADTAIGESSATTAASEEPSAGTEMTMAVPAPSTPYPTTGGPIEPIADRDQTITTPGQLAGLGVLLADLRDNGTLGATPETSCLFGDPSIEIVDETRFRFPDVTSTVLVALVASDIEGLTLAIDPDSCAILVVGP